MEAATAELEWWPAAPLDGWATGMLEQTIGAEAESYRPAIVQVCKDKCTLEVRCWAERKLSDMRRRVRGHIESGDSCLVLLEDRERVVEGDELPADLFSCGVYGL